VLIGDGPNREHLRALGRGLTNPPQFYYLPPDALIPYYSSADLYVHTADVEVECMAVLEAMACGLPCLIARSHKSAAQQFALSPAFSFRWDDVDELTARIDFWVEHPEELRTARTAYLRAAEQYRIDVSVEKLEAAYATVLAMRSGRALAPS
jgi:glycosyltransferase involved in cell wall biosynthesis